MNPQQFPEYKIVSGKTDEHLQFAVNHALEAGWRPVGGIAIRGTTYYQALFRQPEDHPLNPAPRLAKIVGKAR